MKAKFMKKVVAAAMALGMLEGSILGNSISVKAASPAEMGKISYEQMQEAMNTVSFERGEENLSNVDKAPYEALLNDLLGVTQAKVAGRTLAEWNFLDVLEFVEVRVPNLTKDSNECISPNGRWTGYFFPQGDGVQSVSVDSDSYYAYAYRDDNYGTTSVSFWSATPIVLGKLSKLSALSTINGTSFSDFFVEGDSKTITFTDNSYLFLSSESEYDGKYIYYYIPDVGSVSLYYSQGNLMNIGFSRLDGATLPAGVSTEETPGAMYRMFNPFSGEHFYTGSTVERSVLLADQWNYEGIAWIAPTSSNTPVYRLYNPASGAHHYTSDAGEKEELINNQGWNYEGIGWYSDDNKTTPMYRLYDPTGTGAAEVRAHHYTANPEEKDLLTTQGWVYEGISWYGK